MPHVVGSLGDPLLVVPNHHEPLGRAFLTALGHFIDFETLLVYYEATLSLFFSFAGGQMLKRSLSFLVCILVLAGVALAQTNGKLQIHFMDVGQGDGAVLISPNGAVVLFDTGVRNNCDKPLSYLQQLGINHIDYIFVSHYHADHIGCVPQVTEEFPLQHDVFDRGQDYPGLTFQNYVAAIGTHRTSLSAPGRTITLDEGSSNPVTVEVVALNGNGIVTSNENDLSLVALVTFGKFKVEIGGDLSGEPKIQHFGSTTVEYKDIETSVAPKIGHIDVYKVHHHCSSFSSNDTWLTTTHPTIGIVSAGDSNTFGHPSPDCLERLHVHGVKLYWTENGKGGEPEEGLDVVGGNIVVEAAPQATTFTVTSGGSHVDNFAITGGNAVAGPPTPPPSGPTPVATPTTNPTHIPTFAWSKSSKEFHFANCKYVHNIAPGNLVRGDTPPPGKTRHKSCPR